MKNKKYYYKKLFFSIAIIFLFFFSNLASSNSFIKNETKKESNTILPLYSTKNSDLWFDGNFNGCWGENKESIDGYIWGDLNFGRSQSLGRFYGQYNISDERSNGLINGIFRKHLLFGVIKNISDDSNHLFIGLLSFNKTGFKATIFCLGIQTIYINGRYEASFLPPITGPYGVGVKSMHLIDESRLEEFTPDNPDDYREMMIQIWYPIDKEILEPKIDYMDPPTFAWLKGRSPIPLFTIPDNAYQFVCPHGRNEVSISDDEQMYPVIIFSPGYDGVYQIYTSLIEDIVSNGFIVVSINHPYVSGITVFPDGREIYTSPDPPGDLSLRSVVDDAKFVLDTITEINNSDPNFNSRFDLSKVGMYGHSYGGASTSICCYEDSRFSCGLTLDGVFYLEYISEGIDQPFLLMIADNRFNDNNVQNMWDKLNNDGYKVQINGSTHYAFTDVGVLLKHLVPIIPPRLLGFGKIEPKNMVNITRKIELLFFEVYLKDRSVDDLINLLSSYEEVLYDVK